MDKEMLKKYARKAAPYAAVALVSALITTLIVLTATVGMWRQSKLDALESLILERFIGTVDQTELEDAAANAMIEALDDPWSYYIPADEYAQFSEQRQNSYVGIGVTITVRSDGGGLDIAQITAGGGAEKAGLQVGDIIVGVDGENIRGMSTEDVKNMIRGEENTDVVLTVLRSGQEQTFTVRRTSIQTPVATGTLLENGIGVVRIVNFNDKCAKETIAAIEALMEQGAEKLIFDVRFNPGGYVSELVDVLDHLLPKCVLFRMEDYTGNQEIKYSNSDCLDVPMAVLVNGDSYSAAEFFAAALSEYEVAVIVGEQTSGKGYFQNTFELGDGSAAGISVGKYYTPKGVSLAGKGITPDVVYPVDDKTAAKIQAGTLPYDQDPQIQAAIQALNGN